VGTADVENARVGVFLALATSRGRALIDRRRTPHRGRHPRTPTAYIRRSSRAANARVDLDT
jgi:hypothetical protein